MPASSDALGCFVTMRTVCVSGVSIWSMALRYPRPPEPVFGSMIRSYVNFTSSPTSSRPLWNFTPRRSLNVHVRPSALVVHDSASPGSSLPSCPHSTRRL